MITLLGTESIYSYVNTCLLSAGGVQKTVVIPGKAVGYYASGKVPNWTRRHEYYAYRDKVRMLAFHAGIIPPLHADKEHPIYINTFATFGSGVHADPENVRKGIVDALFYGTSRVTMKQASDKFVGGIAMHPVYGDEPNVRIDVFTF